MRRAACAAVAAVLLAGGLAPGVAAASAAPCRGELDRSLPSWWRARSITVINDSVLLSGERALRAAMPCRRIRLVGRPALMLAAAERDLRARGVAPLVVVGIGYNSLWERGRRRYGSWAQRFDREARALVATLRSRGARQIVWVTLREPTRATVPSWAVGELSLYSWYFPYVNERLRRLATERRDVVLADWAAVSRRRGLTYDTIHLNERGGARMARLIRSTIDREARRQASAPRVRPAARRPAPRPSPGTAPRGRSS